MLRGFFKGLGRGLKNPQPFSGTTEFKQQQQFIDSSQSRKIIGCPANSYGANLGRASKAMTHLTKRKLADSNSYNNHIWKTV